LFSLIHLRAPAVRPTACGAECERSRFPTLRKKKAKYGPTSIMLGQGWGTRRELMAKISESMLALPLKFRRRIPDR
jgi:hypothetical protein